MDFRPAMWPGGNFAVNRTQSPAPCWSVHVWPIALLLLVLLPPVVSSQICGFYLEITVSKVEKKEVDIEMSTGIEMSYGLKRAGNLSFFSHPLSLFLGWGGGWVAILNKFTDINKI